MAKTFTREEILVHTKPNDLWIVIHNEVCDISSYGEEHPGGLPLLLEVGGGDATEPFDDNGHSEHARELLQPFLISELSTQEAHKVVEIYRPTFKVVSRVNDTQDVKNVFSHLTIAMMVLILIVVVTASTVYFAQTPGRAENLPVEHLLSAGVTATYGGFWKGFTASTLLAIISAALGLQQLEKALDVQKNIHNYPAHKTIPFKIHSPKQHLRESVLRPQQYRKLPLVQKEMLSPDTYRFMFGLPKSTDILRLPTGQHVAIQAEINGRMVSRSYTPVSNGKDQGYLELVIKVYPQGVMTNYLAALQPNDLVHFRGPKGRMNYHRGLCKDLGMIVGGTGITPAYQIIRAICEDPEDNTRVSLLYANHTEEDILLRGELARLQHQFPSKLSVWYVLNSPPGKWQYGQGRVTKDIIRDKLAAPSSGSKVHLCGPHEMVVAMRRILVELGFEPPRAMSKTDDQIFLF